MTSRTSKCRSPNQDTDTGEETDSVPWVGSLPEAEEASTVCNRGVVDRTLGRLNVSINPQAVSANPVDAGSISVRRTCIANVSVLGDEPPSTEKCAQAETATSERERVQSFQTIDESICRNDETPFSGHTDPSGHSVDVGLPFENCHESPLSSSRSLNDPDSLKKRIARKCLTSRSLENTETREEVGSDARNRNRTSNENEISGMSIPSTTSDQSADITGDRSHAVVAHKIADDDDGIRLVSMRTERLAAGKGEKKEQELDCVLGQLTAALQNLVEVSAGRCPCPSALGELRLFFQTQVQELKSEMENQVRCLESQLHGFKAVLDHLQMRQLRMEMVPGSGFTSDVDTISLTSSGDDDTEETSTCTTSTDSTTSRNDVRCTRNGETGEIPQKEALPGQPDHCMWLRQHLVTLVTNLDLGSSLLLPHLVAEGVLTDTDEEDINSHSTRKDKIRELLLKVRRCPRERFDAFRRCLETEYPHLASLPFYNTETGEDEASQQCVTCDVTRRVALIDVMDALFSAGAISPKAYEQLWRGTSSRQEWSHLLDDMNARDPRLGVQVLVRALEKKHPDLSHRLLRSDMETFACLCPGQPQPHSSSVASGDSLAPRKTFPVPEGNPCDTRGSQGHKNPMPRTASAAAALPRKSEEIFGNPGSRAYDGKVLKAKSRGRPVSVCMASGESIPTTVFQDDPYKDVVRCCLDDKEGIANGLCARVEKLRSQEETDAILTKPKAQTTAPNPQEGHQRKTGPRFKVIIRPKGRNTHYTLQYRLCWSSCSQK